MEMKIMCGIIGYSGPLNAKKILLEGLSQLEYRGYDSAGIAYFDTDSNIRLVKKTGKVANLKEYCSQFKDNAHCGIGPDGPLTATSQTRTPTLTRPERSP